MAGMSFTKPAIFFKFKFLRSISFILGSGVISSFTLGTTQSNYISHT